MNDKKEKVLGNEVKLKSVKRDKSYFQKLEYKERPETCEDADVEARFKRVNKKELVMNEPQEDLSGFVLPIGTKP